MSNVLNMNSTSTIWVLCQQVKKPGVRTGKGSGPLAGHCQFNNDMMEQAALMLGKRFPLKRRPVKMLTSNCVTIQSPQCSQQQFGEHSLQT